MKTPRVLVLDDDSSVRTSLFRILDKRSFQVLTAQKIQEARMICQGENPLDLAIVDLSLPDGDGILYMEELKSLHPQIEVIILTGNASIESAVKATQKGAFHFLTKPFNLEELFSLIDKALSHKKLQSENKHLRSELNKQYKFNQIVGCSSQIKDVLNLVQRVSDTDSTILITGESGTGKELIARAIHYNSHRSQGPFVAINCGAIPAELIESELFGHMKGAFTGAIASRLGKFEQAEGGTLFLDEIGDLPPSMQVKLLRALQERQFEPVGSTKSVQVDVRVVAATNMNLEQAVLESKFREDLYYRLNVIPIHIPALRERTGDIPLLLAHFIQHFQKTRGRGLTGVSQEAAQVLSQYPWPGNIRELENLVERVSIIKGHGALELEDLPLRYRSSKSPKTQTQDLELGDHGLDFNSAVDNFENNLILRALEKTGWNRNQAALLLRLNRTTLVEKIKKKGLKPKEGEEEPIEASS